MHSFWNTLLDLFFPRRSLTGREGEWITEEECKMLAGSPVTIEKDQLRVQGVLHIDAVAAAADFRSAPLLRKAIHTFKYRRIPALSRSLGTLLCAASDVLEIDDHIVPTLCPVPLHWRRRFSRGFNQTELLARRVAEENGWPMMTLLRRVRSTGTQVGRTREERLKGVREAFAMTAGSLPAHVILVDDLFTTGATLEACAEVLKKAGVERVEGLALAVG